MDSRPSLSNDCSPFASMCRRLKLNTRQGTTSVKARLRIWSSTLQKIRQEKKAERARGAFGRFWPIFSFLPDFVGVFYNV